MPPDIIPPDMSSMPPVISSCANAKTERIATIKTETLSAFFIMFSFLDVLLLHTEQSASKKLHSVHIGIEYMKLKVRKQGNFDEISMC